MSGGAISPEELQVAEAVIATKHMARANQANAVYVKEPRVDINRGFKVPVIAGSRITNIKTPTSSNVSNSQVSYEISVSDNVLVDRRWYHKTKFRATITGTPSSGNVYKQSYDAPRAFPYQACCNSLQLKINGLSFSTNLRDYLPALMRYFKQRDYLRSFTGCPAMPDASQQYNDFAASVRNPLGSYLGNSYMTPRGVANAGVVAATVADVYYNVVSNNTNTAVIDITSIEPVLISPLVWGAKDKPAFANVNTLELIFQTDFSQSRFWSHDNIGNPVTNWASSVSAISAQLFYQELSPNDAIPIDKNSIYNYEYYNVQSYPTTVGSVASGATFGPIQAQNLVPANVPTRAFVFVREQNSDQSQNTADAFANINNIQVQFNNQNQLSSSTTHNLFEMSNRNGLIDSFVSWQQYSGSVLCLEFGQDIGLEPDQAPGMGLGKRNLTVTVSGSNISGSTKTYVLYIVLISPGVVSIAQGSASSSLSVVTMEDLIMARHNPFLTYEDVNGNEPFGGGSFFSTIGDAFKKAWDFGKQVLPVAASVVLPGALGRVANKVFDKIGLGRQSGGYPTGGLSLPYGGYADMDGGMYDSEDDMDGGRRKKKTRKPGRPKGKGKKGKAKKGGYVDESYDQLISRLAQS